jgi:hypothetical protein
MSLQAPADLDRQVAYLETLRGLGRPQRMAGMIACLVGVLMMVLARYRLGGAPWLLWPGVGVVALGWGLFLYAVARRLTWIRAHPFDPNAQETSD